MTETNPALAIEARGLVKRFGRNLAVDGVDISVPRGAIYGILGPNGAGKTTTLRMLLGIIDPDAGERLVLGESNPRNVSRLIGYLPEERGLYPSMKAIDAIAFMGALRGLPLKEGRLRAREMMENHGLGDAVERQVRHLSKGMAQTVQLLGTLVHRPSLVFLDEPFAGLDALNQGRLEATIRDLAADGTTVIFSTHVIAHAERLCEEVAIIAGGKVPFAGKVETARDRIPPRVQLETRSDDGPWRDALPADARKEGRSWLFSLPEGEVEDLLKALIASDAGIKSLSIERAGLHDAFVDIAGAAAAQAMKDNHPGETA
ncbi:ABC transporter ATP-binding protein [Altericroceibacterium endophyticum]|uniref:ATP-binding cassette domain-containing protein n=1 Tax=Altericroceibacterium endophyticum TaxID=1808508 RepID=A0A6I4T7M0_9SPHN|nr:ATP-binding cassette domain-containing protein [Altericroceibacterium endophyticum]MXO65785.1 ATP-binding cassette domain-containing protein [Altericroceibacterium endophyticum]